MASTSVGPLVKTNAGLQFVSESGLGILLGLEGSLLAYQNENIWYSSKNLGIMYGMFMRF
jgi:hydrogenase/urease accessory protein HupE